eukprot:9477180-Pyramimonas_sp.AAC.1
MDANHLLYRRRKGGCKKSKKYVQPVLLLVRSLMASSMATQHAHTRARIVSCRPPPVVPKIRGTPLRPYMPHSSAERISGWGVAGARNMHRGRVCVAAKSDDNKRSDSGKGGFWGWVKKSVSSLEEMGIGMDGKPNHKVLVLMARRGPGLSQHRIHHRQKHGDPLQSTCGTSGLPAPLKEIPKTPLSQPLMLHPVSSYYKSCFVCTDGNTGLGDFIGTTLVRGSWEYWMLGYLSKASWGVHLIRLGRCSLHCTSAVRPPHYLRRKPPG